MFSRLLASRFAFVAFLTAIFGAALAVSSMRETVATAAESPASAALPIERTPAVATHALGQQQFYAGIAVRWTASCGTITAGGLYTAPARAGNCTITATSAGGERRGQTTAAVTIANYTGWKNSRGGEGVQSNELHLTPTNVSTGHFAPGWSAGVDGVVWAQPLYLNALTISGKARNVVFVATSNDSVYAFDGDTGALIWKRSFLSPGVTAVSGASLGVTPQTGVLSTPVIDPVSHTMYVVAETLENHATSFIHRLHALDVTTGRDKLSGPVVISNPALQPRLKWQRPALLLANGNVYVGFGSVNDLTPYHGLLFAFSASSLAQIAVFNATSTGSSGGIWMSAAAPTVDSNGEVYVSIGNGNQDFDGVHNFGESVVKLSPSLKVLDYFTPFNWKSLDAADNELGSSNVLVVPPHGGSFPDELIVCGKPSPIYVINRNSMGKVGTTTDHVIQRLDHQIGGSGNVRDSGLPCFTTPSIWKQNVYFVANDDVMKVFTLNTSTGLLSSTPTQRASFVYHWPGSNPVISANGNNNGIVWTIDLNTSTLRANDATNISKVLYVSPKFGTAIRWNVPTVINGHVYVGMQYKIQSYTLH